MPTQGLPFFSLHQLSIPTISPTLRGGVDWAAGGSDESIVSGRGGGGGGGLFGWGTDLLAVVSIGDNSARALFSLFGAPPIHRLCRYKVVWW